EMHRAVPDGDDLVLLYFPLRRKPPHNLPFALWTDPDRDAAGENPVLIVEFVAEGCVRLEQLKGRFRHLPRAAGDEYDFARAGVQPVDELFRAGHRPELPSRPQDLGLGEPSEPLGPRAESHLPVDPTIDSLAGYRGDLRFLPDDRREFREEFGENQGVLYVENNELHGGGHPPEAMRISMLRCAGDRDPAGLRRLACLRRPRVPPPVGG